MDERNPLIQQDCAKPVWYKRKRFIAVCSALAIAACVTVIIVVIVITVPVVVIKNKHCSYSNSYDCLKDVSETCQWCFTDKDGSGYCEPWMDDPDTGLTPLQCTALSDVGVCIAYGFATNEDQEACETFTPSWRSKPCRWSNPTGNCYEDSGMGPTGCCFD